MEFDAARVAVLTGDPGDVVARFPGVVCVARCPDPDLLRRLLHLCSDTAGPDPGRALARSLARWLAGEDDLPDRIVFGTVSTVGNQLAVFLSGAATVEIGDTVLSGTDAASWTDRLLAAPDGPIRLALHGAVGRTGSLPDVLDLRGGVVPGSGAVLQIGAPGSSRPVPSGAGRAFPPEPPRVAPPVERSPLAPDPGQRPHGNGVVPALDIRKPPPAPEPPAAAASPAAPGPPPERPDEPGSDEEFTSGEWFGGQGEPADASAAGRDQSGGGSPWVSPPPPAPPAPPSRHPGRHAVHGRGEQVNTPPAAAADLDLAEPPTPRAGSEAVVDTEAESPPTEQVTQAAPVPDDATEREPAGAVPAPRSAPNEQPTEAAALNGHQNGSTPPAAGAEHQVQGLMCPRGHLNDPRSQFCSQCGGRIDERGSLVVGARPTLGVIVFDDGATYTVDAEYLVGRMPESDQRVSGGDLRAIVVEDRSGAVSRVHAEIHIDGWDVLLSDTGSRNGTFVAGPTQQGWSPLPPGRSRRLVPGTRVRMGGRTFVFESPGGSSSS